jgi:hypothetical protein
MYPKCLSLNIAVLGTWHMPILLGRWKEKRRYRLGAFRQHEESLMFLMALRVFRRDCVGHLRSNVAL